MSLYDGTFALFLDILQPPPRSTLFPYTTLFRSAPMAKVDPAIRSQKAADLTACDMAAELVVDDKEFSSGSASSLNDSAFTPLSSGEDRVTQIPMGKSTSRMNVPSNSSPCRHPKLRARKFTSVGAATPPKPRPR